MNLSTEYVQDLYAETLMKTVNRVRGTHYLISRITVGLL